jgi:hypothetical protein
MTFGTPKITKKDAEPSQLDGSETNQRPRLRGAVMLDTMTRLVELFASRTTDRSTLVELDRIIADRDTWQRAHDLFHRIRIKNLEASRRGDAPLEAQYCFEEACAKTLYNFSCVRAGQRASFDQDCPYWIVPYALSWARRMGIDESEVTNIVAG